MTLKQQLAFKKTMENGGNITQAMRDVGYAESTINNPSNLTKTKPWNDLMDEYLADEKLAKIHSEGLEATKASNAAILVQQDGTMIKAEEQGLIEVADYATRHKYLDTAYKLKKRLQNDSAIQINDAKILVVPSELLDKNEIPFDTIDSSQG